MASSDTSSGLVLEANDVIRQRDTVEAEMDTILEDLNSDTFSNVGLKKPLVDIDGFPLAGIDLHQVSILRNRFVCLSTDSRLLGDRIEQLIHQIHEMARLQGEISTGDKRAAIPFGRVEAVVPGSSAEQGGMLVGDQVIGLGPLSCYSEASIPECYAAIPAVVKNLTSRDLKVKVHRLGREDAPICLNLELIEGRLGCLIKPL